MPIRGIDQLPREFPKLVTAVRDGVAAFRAGGYRNEWIEQKKRFREFELSATLRCSMIQERFALRLTLERAKKVTFDQEIFVSDPDEIAFTHRFKDIVVEEGKVVVFSKYQKPLFALALENTETNKPA